MRSPFAIGAYGTLVIVGMIAAIALGIDRWTKAKYQLQIDSYRTALQDLAPLMAASKILREPMLWKSDTIRYKARKDGYHLVVSGTGKIILRGGSVYFIPIAVDLDEMRISLRYQNKTSGIMVFDRTRGPKATNPQPVNSLDIVMDLGRDRYEFFIEEQPYYLAVEYVEAISSFVFDVFKLEPLYMPASQ